MKTVYSQIEPYVTKDGSLIRELMTPSEHGNRHQSLAEATIAKGAKTRLHRHHSSEELYHILAGVGVMTLESETFAVGKGDTICISPGTAHCIENTGSIPLQILCTCSPAYSHADTELLDS